MNSEKRSRLTRRQFVTSSAAVLTAAGFAPHVEAKTWVQEQLDQPADRGPFRVIIDTDPGVDDALALLFAMRSSELKIEGITSVAGNVPLELTLPNALRMVEIAGRADIPVAAGAKSAGDLGRQVEDRHDDIGPVAGGQREQAAGGQAGQRRAARARVRAIAEEHLVDPRVEDRQVADGRVVERADHAAQTRGQQVEHVGPADVVSRRRQPVAERGGDRVVTGPHGRAEDQEAPALAASEPRTRQTWLGELRAHDHLRDSGANHPLPRTTIYKRVRPAGSSAGLADAIRLLSYCDINSAGPGSGGSA